MTAYTEYTEAETEHIIRMTKTELLKKPELSQIANTSSDECAKLDVLMSLVGSTLMAQMEALNKAGHMRRLNTDEVVAFIVHNFDKEAVRLTFACRMMALRNITL